MDNIKIIHSILTLLDNNTPSRISIFAAASPDGPYSLNKRLSHERAQSAVSLIKRICPSLPDSIFVVNTLEEDIEGTIKYLNESGQSWSDEAVSLLRKGGHDPEEALRHFKGGIAWRYLADNVFPLLRRSEISIIYESKDFSADLISPIATEGSNNQANTPIVDSGNPSQSSTSGKVPAWAIVAMSFLGAAALAFASLYARERRRTRVLNNKLTAGAAELDPPIPVSQEDLYVPETPDSFEEHELPEEPEFAETPEVPSIPVEPAVLAPVVALASSDEAEESSPSELSFLDKVKAKIQENIADSGFGVEELASAMGISRIHLNRKLKTEADSSPSTLLKEARMELAARLLKEGNMSIAEISSLSGFSTPSYFATAFKDYYNISPSEYVSRG